MDKINKNNFNYLDLSLFLNENRLIKKPFLFISKTKESFILGPYTDKNFCFECFRRRINSSSFFEAKNYKKVSNQDIMEIAKSFTKLKIPNNLMVEVFFNKDKKISKIKNHYLIKIPGCEHQND